MTSILQGRDYYKPLRYPQLFTLVDQHEKMHWVPDEIKLDDDIRDWNEKLGDDERKLLTELFRFFVGADSDVLDGYANLTYYFQKTPEAAMLLASIGAREAIHLMSYSLLIDTVGMPENIYKSFLDYGEIADKHDYVHEAYSKLNSSYTNLLTKKVVNESEQVEYWTNLMKVVCITGCFIEGLQLFSSFAVLKNFEHTYKAMPGMNDIVDFSIRDEDIHIQACAELFKIMCEEYNQAVNVDAVKIEIQKICHEMVQLEFRFIDLMFDAANNNIKGLTKDELKAFITSLANSRLIQFEIDPIYAHTENPLKWLDFLIYAKGHANFFERRSTEYAKGTITGEMTDESFDF